MESILDTELAVNFSECLLHRRIEPRTKNVRYESANNPGPVGLSHGCLRTTGGGEHLIVGLQSVGSERKNRKRICCQGKSHGEGAGACGTHRTLFRLFTSATKEVAAGGPWNAYTGGGE